MTRRTSETTVTFGRPFRLPGFDEPLPAGSYRVETDEEPIEGLSFTAYRRVLTVLHLRDGALTVDPAALEAALERDRAGAAGPAGSLRS